MWTARPALPATRRSRANTVLATLTLVAMGSAAALPADGSPVAANLPGSVAAPPVAEVALPDRGEIRPAPLTRSPLERHATVPSDSADQTPPVVAEGEAKAALRTPDDRVPDVPPPPAEPAPARAAPAEPVAAERAASAFPEGPSRLFANRDGVNLYTPSADPVYVGFHEASYGNALTMLPLGEAVSNDNAHKYHGPGRSPTGQRFSVMSSRGRPHHATTAADIVMRPGEPVRSVVTGTVIEVKPYFLYGKHADAMVRIRAAEDPSMVVTMLHVTRVWVQVGQQVNAGDTLIAETATSFPFMSQIDYYLGDQPNPHVHVELKRE